MDKNTHTTKYEYFNEGLFLISELLESNQRPFDILRYLTNQLQSKALPIELSSVFPLFYNIFSLYSLFHNIYFNNSLLFSSFDGIHYS